MHIYACFGASVTKVKMCQAYLLHAKSLFHYSVLRDRSCTLGLTSKTQQKMWVFGLVKFSLNCYKIKLSNLTVKNSLGQQYEGGSIYNGNMPINRKVLYL